MAARSGDGGAGSSGAMMPSAGGAAGDGEGEGLDMTAGQSKGSPLV